MSVSLLACARVHSCLCGKGVGVSGCTHACVRVCIHAKAQESNDTACLTTDAPVAPFRLILLEDASYDLVELSANALQLLILAQPDAYVALAQQLVQQVRSAVLNTHKKKALFICGQHCKVLCC